MRWTQKFISLVIKTENFWKTKNFYDRENAIIPQMIILLTIVLLRLKTSETWTNSTDSQLCTLLTSTSIELHSDCFHKVILSQGYKNILIKINLTSNGGYYFMFIFQMFPT